MRKVNSIVGDISSAYDEQSRGLNEIHQSLTQMNTVTQQNSALVEEAAAASDALSDQSRELAKLVSSFRVGKESGRGNKLHVVRNDPYSAIG